MNIKSGKRLDVLKLIKEFFTAKCYECEGKGREIIREYGRCDNCGDGSTYGGGGYDYQQTCFKCGGDGEMVVSWRYGVNSCSKCEGTGRIPLGW